MKTIYGSCGQEDSGKLRKRLEDRQLKTMHGKQTKKRWILTGKVA
ncbi:hypothetical protein [uncultured Shewanella sp.]|nr:hypothetical protein [uncultured Shewanella sp.]